LYSEGVRMVARSSDACANGDYDRAELIFRLRVV
jgi:hypothetical protein